MFFSKPKRLLCRFFALGFAAFFLSACSLTQPSPERSAEAGVYDYMPKEGEGFATIEGSPIISGILNAPAGSAYITHVDGKIVPYIDDGGFQWMLYGSRMLGTQYPLTPGNHIITYELKAGTAAAFQTQFVAVAGKRYILRAVNEVENNHSLARFRSWIEDSEANTITMDQITGRQ